MFRKTIFMLALSILMGPISACKSDKGMDFIGRWTGTDERKPMTLDIRYDDGVFHIDEKFSAFGKEFDKKLEGKAESGSVLSVKGGVLTMRLEDGKVFYKNRIFIKSE